MSVRVHWSLHPAVPWLGIALCLAGCTVGPDFKAPAAPAVSGYTPEPLPGQLVVDKQPADPTQTLQPGLDIPGAWWDLFHSKPLADLVARALTHNADLTTAQAALRQARENIYAQEGSYFPSVDANFSPGRNKTATGAVSPASASGNPYYSLYTAQLGISYNPDVFGLNRRQVESLVAQAQSQRYQLEATYLTLTANLVAAAITEASLRAQISATEQIIKIESGLRDIMRKQMALGQIAQIDELAQDAALAQAEATLPPLHKQLEQQRDLITALSGRLPGEGTPEQFDLASLHLPEALPISLPSKLVEQRPDIKQAEENLHSASALIGVAVANRLPLLNLTASVGSQANAFNALFTPGTGFWTLAASVTQPIFQGGTLLHRQRAAEAAFDQAASQYRSTVITAFQNVADALRALQTDADAVRLAKVAEATSAAALRITDAQLHLGAVAYLSVLNAEQSEFQARLTLVQAQATRLADTAALFQALGGGWWHRDDVQVKDVTGDDVLGVIGLR
jgi:NodT family efflux transporter outer membrane factor (OMF) lipoprotein